MEVIYGLIPGMIIMGMVAVAILFWAARNGQYDDMDGEAHRILMDDDLEPEIEDQQTQASVQGEQPQEQNQKDEKRFPD